MCGVRCELKDGKARCTMCILDFSSSSTEFGELKDEKARMLHVHPGSHLLSSSRLAGIASCLAGVAAWLAEVSLWLAGVSSWLAGVSSWLAGVFFLAGGSVFLVGWCLFLAGWSVSSICCLTFFLEFGWNCFLAGWALKKPLVRVFKEPYTAL